MVAATTPGTVPMHLEHLRTNGVVTLSEPSLMAYLDGVPEFLVSDRRELEHPHFRLLELFVRHPASGTELLLVDRLTAGADGHDDVLAVFQQDHAGAVAELAAEHLDAGRENFAAAFAAHYEAPGEESATVTYHLLQGEQFHGVRLRGEDHGPPISQAFYATDDDPEFSLALIEWEGDWITAWFGKPLRRDQVSPL